MTAYASFGDEYTDTKSMALCSDDENDEHHEDDDDDNIRHGRMLLFDLRKRLRITTVSTAFSGIDSPGTSLEQLRVSLDMMLDGKVGECPSRHLHATEWFGPSQDELMNHPHRPGCLFGNIEDFLSPILKPQLPTLVANDQLELLTQLLMENNKAIQPLGS